MSCDNETCILCRGSSIKELRPLKDKRNYFFCEDCYLIFASAQYHLSRKSETQHYLLHDNGPGNQGHVNFLRRIVDPALPYLTPGMSGLDYGCGPVPTLSVILRGEGLVCYDYDPLFDFDHPLEKYHYIFATECFEHFFNPEADFRKIDQLLLPGGFLAIMTERWNVLADFHTWYYKTEITHVSFFHTKTFEYICKNYQYRIRFRDHNRIIILQKL